MNPEQPPSPEQPVPEKEPKLTGFLKARRKIMEALLLDLPREIGEKEREINEKKDEIRDLPDRMKELKKEIKNLKNKVKKAAGEEKNTLEMELENKEDAFIYNTMGIGKIVLEEDLKSLEKQREKLMEKLQKIKEEIDKTKN